MSETSGEVSVISLDHMIFGCCFSFNIIFVVGILSNDKHDALHLLVVFFDFFFSRFGFWVILRCTRVPKLTQCKFENFISFTIYQYLLASDHRHNWFVIS